MLRVAVRLATTAKNQVGGGLKGDALLEIGSHVAIGGIAGVLAIDDGGHALEGFADLGLVGDAVMQPVGDVLARDAQGGSIFHQSDVVDVGYLGAAHALVHPAYDVAEDALGVVVELLLDLVCAQGAVGAQELAPASG